MSLKIPIGMFFSKDLRLIWWMSRCKQD
ncbi:uncharacterized protein J3R85_012034 [Psidium guajava]|nr:uncharacterized protein J3R85_012034 [Psidium guajava]